MTLAPIIPHLIRQIRIPQRWGRGKFIVVSEKTEAEGGDKVSEVGGRIIKRLPSEVF